MRNVLMLSYVFPPMGGVGAQRTLKFVKYLPLYGWRPIVVTIKPYAGHVMDYTLIKEVIPEVKVKRCYSLELRRMPLVLQPFLRWDFVMKCRRVFHIPDHCIGWFPFALMSSVKLIREKKVDAIYSSSPPGTAHLIAYFLKRKFGLPWVADFRDPWTHHSRFISRVPRIYRKLSRNMEKLTLSQADKIIVTADQLRRNFLESYPRLNRKIIIITNGFDETDFEEFCSRSSYRSFAKSKDRPFIITYAGDPGSLDLSAFFKALHTLISEGKVRKSELKLRFIGNTSLKTQRINNLPFFQAAEEVGLGEIIEYLGYLPHKEALSLMVESDVLLLYSWGANLIPAKTFEYLRAKRPILTLAEEGDELANLIHRSNAGFVVLPGDESLIAKALWYLHAERKNKPGNPLASKEFLAQYERKVLTARLAQVFDELITAERR